MNEQRIFDPRTQYWFQSGTNWSQPLGWPWPNPTKGSEAPLARKETVKGSMPASSTGI